MLRFHLGRSVTCVAAVFALAAGTVSCSSGATTPPAGSLDLANPPEVVSAQGVARLTLQAAIDPRIKRA